MMKKKAEEFGRGVRGGSCKALLFFFFFFFFFFFQVTIIKNIYQVLLSDVFFSSGFYFPGSEGAGEKKKKIRR